MSELQDFHFIRPLWLLAVPLAVLLFGLVQRRSQAGQWSEYLPPAMLSALQVSMSARSKVWPWLSLFAVCVLIIASAGPTMSQQAVPTVRNAGALVIALDLSPSMLAEDLTPSRLERAKFKLIDILRAQADGQVALIAYAGDAHTVSPLTDDPQTIQALLPALHPNVMPIAGSNTEAALDLAQNLLRDAGLSQGDILLITDGVAQDAARYIANRLEVGNTVSILGVSGIEPAPIPKAGGGFVQTSRGEIVLTAVDAVGLRKLASQAGGQFARISTTDSDLARILKDRFEQPDEVVEVEGLGKWSSWDDLGHWLVLLVLPFALYSFRKGLIYVLPLVIMLPQDASAQSWFETLWKTPDQRAAQLFEQGEFDQAANAFERPDWQAVSQYRAGNYTESAKQFAALQDRLGLEALYNQGNALAMSGDFKGALAAYKRVLEAAPQHSDALHNKAVIEDILQQQNQDQQNQDQQNQDQQNQDQQNQDQQNQDQQNQDQQNQDQQNQDQQNQDQQNQDQQNQDQQNQDQQNQDQQNQDQQNQDQQNQDQQNQDQQNQDQQKQDQQNQDQQNQDQQNQDQQNQDQQNQDQQNQDQQNQDQQNQDQQTSSTESQDDELEASDETDEAPLPPVEPDLSEASEQWLRTIKDDPSGLLRRKFDYQSRLRAQENDSTTQGEERY
ncbi:vWA domain-containing protein [Arenicella xantha]|uniref:Ca-activated chloride channel family protein n=1 Tax=Arenicella xantha TaxID=644221 RepID=A0A395JNB2_9GAMM|nr:VWA domain-containing protein [Arenicella xantha]RBP51287.1 Ca-activated chloride channel family protein [Arenicella xantha]